MLLLKESKGIGFLLIAIVINYVTKCSGNSYELCTRNNCSTASYGRDTNLVVEHLVQCSMKAKMCDNVRGTGIPIEKPEKRSCSWNVYEDSTGEQRISLNMSWSPQPSERIEDLRGYEIKVYKLGRVPSMAERILGYYCLNERLIYQQSSNVTFFYDCYDTLPGVTVRPGDTFHFIISSIPLSKTEDNVLELVIPIPDCNDAKIAHVSECSALKEQNLRSWINNINCMNYSVSFSYFVPKKYGNSAVLLILNCDDSKDSFLCKEVLIWKHLPLNGTLYNLTLPMGQNAEAIYSIRIFGSDKRIHISQNTFSFRKCNIEKESKGLGALSIIAPVLVVGVLVFFFIVFIRLKSNTCSAFCVGNARNSATLRKPLLDKPVANEEDKRKSVFIVYVRDNDAHMNAIETLARYLMHDLGFDVTLDVFDEQIKSDNISLWYEESLSRADKVLVIWSPEAKARYESQEEGTKVVENDYIFISVLRQIKRDRLIRDVNSKKYIFATFDICDDKDSIPQGTNCLGMESMKIMRDFEDLYFRLRGVQRSSATQSTSVEKVLPDRYFDRALNKYGHELYEALQNLV